MEKKSIQFIKTAAGKLRDGKLKRLGGKEISDALLGVTDTLGLETKEEAIIFAAIFDRSCSGRSSDLDDLAIYYGASQLDVMEYVPALKSLIKKGFVIQTDLSESRLVRQNFMVTNYVIGCILENRKPDCGSARILEKEFDRYDFVKLADEFIHDNDLTTEAVFQAVESLERDHKSMSLVADANKIIPSTPDRTLFYEICNDFLFRDGNGRSDVSSTLQSMYNSFGPRFRVKKEILDGTHILLKADLVELTSDKENIYLTDRGRMLFLGEDLGAFSPQYSNLNVYSFAKSVKEYVHGDSHDVDKPGVLKRLAEKIRLIEESNQGMKSITRIAGIIPEEDFRALFYIACDACANADFLSQTRELSSLYPLKERNKYIKEFKEEIHRLQRLDLLELETKSSLFGEYTVLQLTDKGKELYFGEDASLYIEKPEKKDLISAKDIKEKRLFFSPKEQSQLSMVGESLQQENYLNLVNRLEEKGLSRGIAILLYGAPGTGKTESVMQWARATGRDIIHVDISASKSMWYGESEKIIKAIFTKYRRHCKRSTLTPILLFNEADAIFASRKTGNNSSIDQTENAIQNIILEEMEKLEGILIATTNLADNLDKAFERRFLFKIRFSKTSVEAKTLIWKDKLPCLSDETAQSLASCYDLSGGEIDNVVRKALMSEIIEGNEPTAASIVKFCAEEKIGRDSSTSVGFRI